MVDLRDRVERRRRDLGLTQTALAKACDLSQGHVSKLMASHAPIGKAAQRALEAWLAANEPGTDQVDLAALAAEIEAKCITLMQLARRLALRGPSVSKE